MERLPCPHRRKNLCFGFGLGTWLALASFSVAHAATYTYVGSGGTTATPVKGNFSGAGFTPTLDSGSGTPISTTADTLVFGGNAAYTATDDFTATTSANVLSFTNTAAVTLAKSTATGAANSFTLGGTAPSISLGNTAGAAGLVTDDVDLILSATTTVTGAGNLTLFDMVTDRGSASGLTMNGTGTLTLAGPTSYSGTTTLNNGTVAVASDELSVNSALVFSSTTVAALNFLGTHPTESLGSISAPTFVSGSGINLNGGTLTVGSDNTSTVYNDKFTSPGTLNKIGSGNLTLGGSVDNGALALTLGPSGTTNTGTVILNKTGTGNHAVGGSLTINGGTLQLGTSSNGDQIADNVTVTMYAGTFDLNGQSETIGAVISTRSGITFTNSNAGTSSVLTFGATSGTSASSANITNGAGTLGISKTGAGIQTLSGTNTYTGTTTIGGGALIISAASTSTASGPVNVNAGTLLGNGYAPTGLLTVSSGANLAPGATTTTAAPTVAASAGTLHIGALTLDAGANFNVFLSNNSSATGAGAGADYSQLVSNGTDTLGGNLNLNTTGTLTVGDKFFILVNSSTAATSGTFSNVTGTTFTSGANTFTINYADNFNNGTVANDVSLTVVAPVPEPGTWLGAVLSVGMLGFIKRRPLGAWLGLARRS